VALFDSTVTRDEFIARAKVSAAPDRKGTISFSIGDAFVELTAWDAECIARLLLNAAGERRSHDENEN